MTLSLTPVLEPVISGGVSLEMSNVGVIVTRDATQTPNNSGQIPESGFHWDTNGDGVDDTAGSSVNVSWAGPTNVTIRLTVVATDGRSASAYQSIEIADISAPEVSIGASSVLERSFGAAVVPRAVVIDNGRVATI